MLAVLIVLGLVAYLFAVPSPGKETPPVVVEHHHHHVTVIERPIVVQAHVHLTKVEIVLTERGEPAAVRTSDDRLLLTPSAAIERYRSQERKPS